ncbi:MAG TPA: M50 family metallopeptidase [Blastocatellia bacterium]|nr:M50 family metallopeptidase [Blastocatellia bacterium]
MQSQKEIKASFKLLVFASLLTVVLWFIPFAGVITYPIVLFSTLIHEAGHAIAALLTFGSVERITMDWNGNGLTLARVAWKIPYISAGYVSTMLYGASLLLFLRRERNARTAAIGTGILLLLITIFFAGNIVAWLTGLFFGVGCLALALKGKPRLTHFLMSFLAVQCVLNAFYELRVLLFLSAYDSRIPNDAVFMSEATGGFIPAVVWAIGWSLLAAAMLVGTLVVYYRSLRRRAEAVEMQLPTLLTDHSANVSQPHV